MAAVYRTFPVGRAAGQTISEGRIIRTCLTAGRFVICGAMQYRELRIEVAAPYAEPLSELLGERLRRPSVGPAFTCIWMTAKCPQCRTF